MLSYTIIKEAIYLKKFLQFYNNTNNSIDSYFNWGIKNNYIRTHINLFIEKDLRIKIIKLYPET
jgi:hypothetical protein